MPLEASDRATRPVGAPADGAPMDDPVLIFLHLPKTGGTTLHAIIERHFPPGATLRVRNDTLDRFFALTDAQRRSLRYLSGHMPFGLHQWLPRPAEYITMLREPVARAVSLYYYGLTDPGHPRHTRMVAENVSLEGHAQMHGGNAMTRWLCGYYEGRQTWIGRWMPPDAAQDALQRARHNLATHFSVVGLTERFDESLLMLRRRFGWRRIFYVRENVTRGRPPREALPPETLRLIEGRNALDIDLYAHAARIFEAQLQEAGVTRSEALAFRSLNKALGALVRARRAVQPRRRIRALLKRRDAQ
ncbi:MAG: sulfotransferase family 2 domain-containing protein [Anaerolineae bacterium]